MHRGARVNFSKCTPNGPSTLTSASLVCILLRMKGIVPRVIPEMLIYALFRNQIIDEGGRPKIQVEYKAEKKTFFAEEVCVSSQILQSFAIPQLYFVKRRRRPLVTVVLNLTSMQLTAVKYVT